MQREPYKALSTRQPWAELILRRDKCMEFRTQITKMRGRVYVYAALGKPDELNGSVSESLVTVGMSWDELPKGVLVGTVEITGCEASDDGYEWQLANPVRLETPPKPQNQSQAVWFNPFDQVGPVRGLLNNNYSDSSPTSLARCLSETPISQMKKSEISTVGHRTNEPPSKKILKDYDNEIAELKKQSRTARNLPEE